MSQLSFKVLCCLLGLLAPVAVTGFAVASNREVDSFGCKMFCKAAALHQNPNSMDPDCTGCCVSCCGASASMPCTFWGWSQSQGCLTNKVKSTLGVTDGVMATCDQIATTPEPPVAGQVDCSTVDQQTQPTLQRFDGGAVTTNADGDYILEPEDGAYYVKTAMYPACTYPNNADWLWKFKTTNDKILKITIKEMYLQSSDNCDKDFLRVGGISYNDKSYKDHCGVMSDQKYKTEFSRGVLKFMTDDKTRRDGFIVHVEALTDTWQ